MKLRRSEFLHLLPLSENIVLAVHAMTQARVTITPQVAAVLQAFDTPGEPEDVLPALAAALGQPQDLLHRCANLLLSRGLLSERSAEEERAALAAELSPTLGRDPAELLDRYRRARAEGTHAYWSVAAPRALDDAPPGRRVDALLFGTCDVQMEADFLRREAAARGIDLHVAASFPEDVALARERRHDVVIVGALAARHAIVLGDARHHEGDPARVYVDAARALLTRLRNATAAPILLDGLPEPTVQPLGFADRGAHGHRNRFRRTNLALEDMAENFADVFVVDSAATLAAEGSAALLDDGLVGFTHFGSAGWMLQRPESERAAVHHQFPDLAPLAQQVGGDPYRREAAMARAHMDAIAVVLGINRKKCVITDLDGVLWPGVLAETGRPFAWSPEISSANSYVGLYFGIHEALRALRQRGIVLACVSRNDEATVRELWRYNADYPRHMLLTPDSFVTWRVNWEDKAKNIRSIADELGFAPDAFVFIDDSPRERERVRQEFSEITVLGDDLFSLRRTLLTDPRLQVPHLTAEAPQRSELVRAQLQRNRLRAAATDEAAFIASLDVACTVERLTPDAEDPVLTRVQELFARTTQCNATGRTFPVAELRARIGGVFTLTMRDRLADHGLVGAAVLDGTDILNVVMSCRVIGLGGERALLDAVVAAGGRRGRIVPTARNLPVRNLFRDRGFIEQGDGWWALPAPGAVLAA